MFVEFCWIFFGVFLVLSILLQGYVRFQDQQQVQSQFDTEFNKFQRIYLLIFYIVMLADWLQGPYVYALYDSYGFGKEDIAILFIVGFGSSALFGTFVGSLADKYGRRKLSIYFGIIYAISCVTKLFNNFWVLMLGRFLSGIATSLLFSVFEAWMVHEHTHRGFPTESLSHTFSIAIFGNGVGAILAGIVASRVSIIFGYVAPFMVSLGLLLISSVLVWFAWTENYGNSEVVIHKIFSGAVDAIRKDTRILLLGIVQSLFEASMYVFVFMWTPMLEEEFKEFKDVSLGLHGLIFSTFMVMIMFGSSLFRFLEKKWNIEQIYCGVLAVSTIMFLCVVTVGNNYRLYLSFMVFEICCGLHFTCIGTLRGKYIPEESRAAIMNLFRLPLNILVCCLLYWIESFSNTGVFVACVVWLGIATVCQFILVSWRPPVIVRSDTL